MKCPTKHQSWKNGSHAVMAILFVLSIAASPMAQAQTLTVLHQFTGGADGANPYAGMVFDRAGNLYGAAGYGGNSSCFSPGGSGCGTVFKLTRRPAGSLFTTLYAFAGGTDSSNPSGNVTIAADGTVYGTADAGGGGNCRDQEGHGCGTVFRLQPPPTNCSSSNCSWNETTLYRFTGGTDGNDPFAGVVLDEAGNVYGTAAAGGAYSGGVVYALAHSGSGWTESTLHSFGNGSDGASPFAGLTLDGNGNLYGATAEGGTGCGTEGCGTVFEMTPSEQGWGENILYHFQNSYGPEGALIFDPAGNLYGTTTSGTIYEMTPANGSWLYSSLYALSFDGLPVFESSLTRDAAGNFYGVTGLGGSGCGYGCGTIYKLSPFGGGWSYTVLYQFTGGNDGANPTGSVLVDSSGNLFGTASTGGRYNYGTVWEFTP